MDGLVPLLPLVAFALIFWLLLVRPNMRRERERRAMQSGLAVGDRIILTSGFFGTIRTLHDDRADIELAPGTTVTVALGAVAGLDPAAADTSSGEPTPDLRKSAHPTTSDAPTSPPESEEN